MITDDYSNCHGEIFSRLRKGMRYLAIDFETNGRPNDCVLPCGAYPTQVSVTAFVPSSGEVTHLYDSFIRGARSLSDWVVEHTPVTLDVLWGAPPAVEVSAALVELWQEGDIVVAHNATFDLGVVLPKIANADHPFLTAPRVCTMREGWTRFACGKQPGLADLCKFLGVPFRPAEAHDATYDTMTLARCLKAAHERGCSWSVKVPAAPPQPTGGDVLKFGKHCGQTFDWVCKHDRGYCDWFLEAETGTRTGNAMRFSKYLKANAKRKMHGPWVRCTQAPSDLSQGEPMR